MRYMPMREVPAKAQYKPGDLLVLFGELFTRGYANGLLEEAKHAGLSVVYATVGRREGENLRPLTPEELKNQPHPTINIPLEAGFDMEPCSDGSTPMDQVKSVKMDEWPQVKLDWNKIKDSQMRATERTKKHFAQFMVELEKHIKPGQNVLMAHLMAGGVPRAKIYMAALNRVVKPRGDKFISSKEFWESDLGRFADLNFNDVTANTFKWLIEAAKPLIEKLKTTGGSMRFTAYGYHGTEVMVGDKYQWQSYAPYIQGWAKLLLEKHADDFTKQGISACVYNCPEILTNSSSIFQGVEVPLYPLLRAFRKENPTNHHTKKLFEQCESLLKDGVKADDLFKITDRFYHSPTIIQNFNKFENWPEHNGQKQMEELIQCSQEIIDKHKDPKKLITFVLSEEILRGTGRLIFNDSFKMKQPVWWLNHDIVVKQVLGSN